MKIVFLHGIGDGDPNLNWLAGLNRGLEQAGYPKIERSQVIAPRYSSYLKTDGIRAKLPPLTYDSKDEGASQSEFERRQAAVQRALQLEPGVTWFGFNRVIPDAARSRLAPFIVGRTGHFDLDQVRRYIREEAVRGAVMSKIIDDLPSYGDIILIAHSLGSIVAIDLLDRLPGDLHIRRFLTIGSPANIKALHEGSERLLRKFPYSRVDDWSNFLSRMDVVTGGRGLASVFPGAQDFEINASGHGAEKYLGETPIARLVGELLHPSKALVPATSDMVVRMSDDDAAVLLMHHFAESVAKKIKDENRAARYRAALRLLRDDLGSQMAQRAASGQPLALEMQQLADGQLPNLPHRWELSEAVGELAVLAMTNCVAPYEIEVGEAPMLALEDGAALLGFRTSHGQAVGRAIREVQAVLNNKGGVPWGKVLTAAAGVALVAAGPLGLAVAPATAFGAAAIAGAAIGGGAGGGGPIANDGPVLARLVLRVSTEHARNSLALPFDGTLWFELTDFESQISAALNRLTVFSDGKAPRIAQLREIQVAVQALLRFMLERGLAPAEITEA